MGAKRMVRRTYHRLESSTQSLKTACQQRDSREVWGGVPQHGFQPVVQAYVGPLASNGNGIEFTTDVEPEPLSPPGQAEWRPPRVPVRIVAGREFAILYPITVTRIVHEGKEQ